MIIFVIGKFWDEKEVGVWAYEVHTFGADQRTEAGACAIALQKRRPKATVWVADERSEVETSYRLVKSDRM